MRFRDELDATRDDKSRRSLLNLIAYIERRLGGEAYLATSVGDELARLRVIGLHVSKCYECERLGIWQHDTLIYPAVESGPAPHAEMPEPLRRDFDEASAIVATSPRSAAALLRLLIEKLVDHLHAKGDNLNQKIGHLVGRGLDEHLQMALDAVRVIGNNAVHPGQIELTDDRETALKLFDLVNLLIEDLIARPKRINAAYSLIPPEKRAEIEKRNAKAKADADKKTAP